MFWALLSGIGAACDSAYYIVNRQYLKKVNPDLLAASGFLTGAVFLLALAAARGLPSLGPGFFVAVAATSAINIAGTTLAFRALKSTDISLAVPMLCFTPLFLILTAAVMLGEVPSGAGIAGIVIIVAGSYILNTAAEHEQLLDPFRAMIREQGVLSMLLVAFLYAISIGFDKMVVLSSDTVFGSGIVYAVLGSAFLAIFLIRRQMQDRPSKESMGAGAVAGPVHGSRTRDLFTAGILIGGLLAIEAIVINEAYLVQIVPYVSAIKRMSIILTVLYGTIVIREEETLRRLAGAGMMVAGAGIILLFP